MVRNKEYWQPFLFMIVCMGVCMLIAFSFDSTIGFLLLMNNAIVLVICCGFTSYRYHKIQQLSSYLSKVYDNQEFFDIRDHREGELSILKSDIYKLTQVLKHQNEALLNDKLFLADSLSNISHQLKTPLTSMFVMTDLLKEETLPRDKKLTFLNQLHMQLDRIEWLVSSLLKMSKIDAETVLFVRKKQSLSILLEETLRTIQIPMELKNQNLIVECNPTITVEVDKNWTKEAILNIVKNAHEHTPEHGSIQILCRDNPLHTEILICDDGEGIDPQDQAHVFERFYKGKSSKSDSVGIGLAMSKTILMKQHASIDFKSAIGKGTTFRIQLFK